MLEFLKLDLSRLLARLSEDFNVWDDLALNGCGRAAVDVDAEVFGYRLILVRC